MLLDKSADGFSYFCLTNGTLVGDDLRRRMAPLVPHLRRAVQIGRQLHGQTPKTLLETLPKTRLKTPIEFALDALCGVDRLIGHG